MNKYDASMATNAEILLENSDEMIATLKEAQKYISDMNPGLAFKLWHKAELDLTVFIKQANKIKEEHGTPSKKD